jgi:hypothetical protein
MRDIRWTVDTLNERISLYKPSEPPLEPEFHREALPGRRDSLY